MHNSSANCPAPGIECAKNGVFKHFENQCRNSPYYISRLKIAVRFMQAYQSTPPQKRNNRALHCTGLNHK